MADEIPTIQTPVEAIRAIQNFLINRTAAMPDDVRDYLKEQIDPANSPVTAAVNVAEKLYARRDELPAELLEIGAQVATMAASFNFHGLANENRGFALASEMRRQGGLGKAPTGKLAAPEPRAGLGKATPPERPSAAPVEPPSVVMAPEQPSAPEAP